MYIGPVLTDFMLEAHKIQTEEEIKQLVSEMAEILEMPKFALVSHVDLAQAGAGTVAITNYDEEWVQRILLKRYYLDDPLHAASTIRRVGFAWHEAGDILSLSRRQATILDEAAGFGLNDGITIPVHSPGEFRGTCSFGGAKNVSPSRQLLAAVHLIATFAFEAARRIMETKSRLSPVFVPTFSPRQVDCVSLVAAGLGDKEIAIKLGLSPDTVHQYLTDAMRRCQVVRRGALVFRSLFHGNICYQGIRTSPFLGE